MTGTATRSTRLVSGRAVAQLLHPRPVFLVTACDAGEHANVSTVAWVTPLSHEPPVVGMSVRPGSRTHALVVETHQFVVNVVGASLRRAVEACGETSGWHDDKIESCELETEPASRVASPRLAGALAWLECEVAERVGAGDHVLFIARVLEAQASEDYPPEGKDTDEAAVLLCAAHNLFGRFVHEEEP